MTQQSPGEITVLLQQIARGEAGADQLLADLVYAELRRMAGGFMAGEQPGHTLQPTALVNEAFLRLLHCEVNWTDRNHFMAIAAREMRRILVDHARAKKARRRGGPNRRQITLDEALVVSEENELQILEIDEALNRLNRIAPKPCRVVEMKFFAGMDLAEIAGVLGVTDRTVKRYWKYARGWLFAELSRSAPEEANERESRDDRE